jgi:hypothetical protein
VRTDGSVCPIQDPWFSSRQKILPQRSGKKSHTKTRSTRRINLRLDGGGSSGVIRGLIPRLRYTL